VLNHCILFSLNIGLHLQEDCPCGFLEENAQTKAGLSRQILARAEGTSARARQKEQSVRVVELRR
jgi:hypothetical protein